MDYKELDRIAGMPADERPVTMDPFETRSHVVTFGTHSKAHRYTCLDCEVYMNEQVCWMCGKFTESKQMLHGTIEERVCVLRDEFFRTPPIDDLEPYHGIMSLLETAPSEPTAPNTVPSWYAWLGIGTVA